MEKPNAAHCLVLSYPGQGHINPMLQFSKLLQHEGVKVTLVTTSFYYKSLHKLPDSISVETISDGFDNGGLGEPKNYKLYFDRFWQVGPQSLAELIEKLNGSNFPVDCLIYDSAFPWALEVAKKFGIVGVAFFTQNMVVNSIYYHAHLGKLKVPLIEEEISLPMLPKLQRSDMPSFFFTYEKYPDFLDLVMAQFSNINKADWILCNSFYELNKEVDDWAMKLWPNFKTIGPSIPTTFLDKRIKHDEDYGAAQFKSEECIDWLNNKPKNSAVYISFGSLATLNEEQLEEVVCGLKYSEKYYLWVVKASEEIKLPKDFEKKSEKGLVVTWCSQLKVLAHEAIACFVTHCGWNSTLEAISFGVPVIGIPQWSDQSTNAKLITDVWKIGIRAQADEKQIVRKDVLKQCISELMENEKGKVIKSNVMQLKAMAISTASVGGSSHNNIKHFVSNLNRIMAK